MAMTNSRIAEKEKVPVAFVEIELTGKKHYILQNGSGYFLQDPNDPQKTTYIADAGIRSIDMVKTLATRRILLNLIKELL